MSNRRRLIALISSKSKLKEPVDYKARVPVSPVSHHLSSVAIPSESEKAATLQYTQTLKDRLLTLDDEINGLVLLVRDKVLENSALNDAINEYEAIFHPLRSLAPEILSEIFLHCQFGGTLDKYPYIPNSFHPLQGPLLLTQVCKWWRMVAIATPGLWTTLKVKFKDGQSPELKQTQLALLSTWISRSGSLPLTIGIHVKRYISSSALQDPVINQLLAHSERCREFFWITDHRLQLDCILSLLHENTTIFPILEEYSFITRKDDVRNFHRQNGYGPITTPPESYFSKLFPNSEICDYTRYSIFGVLTFPLNA